MVVEKVQFLFQLRTLDLRISYCDLIIYLDIPRIVCLYSIIKRRIQYANKSREDMQKD